MVSCHDSYRNDESAAVDIRRDVQALGRQHSNPTKSASSPASKAFDCLVVPVTALLVAVSVLGPVLTFSQASRGLRPRACGAHPLYPEPGVGFNFRPIKSFRWVLQTQWDPLFSFKVWALSSYRLHRYALVPLPAFVVLWLLFQTRLSFVENGGFFNLALPTLKAIASPLICSRCAALGTRPTGPAIPADA